MKRRSPLDRAIRFALTGSLATAALGAAYAQDTKTDRVLETVRVSASALDEDAKNLAAPFSIQDGQALFERSQPTLGDTSNILPGVSSVRLAEAPAVR